MINETFHIYQHNGHTCGHLETLFKPTGAGEGGMKHFEYF